MAVCPPKSDFSLDFGNAVSKIYCFAVRCTRICINVCLFGIFRAFLKYYQSAAKKTFSVRLGINCPCPKLIIRLYRVVCH